MKYTVTNFAIAMLLSQFVNMEINLRVATFNCCEIKTSLSTVYDLCDNSDIAFLQETLLFPHELSVLSTAHPEFEGMSVSAIDTTERIIVRHPYGGVAILIRKELREYCNFLFYDDPRIMGIEFFFCIGRIHS